MTNELINKSIFQDAFSEEVWRTTYKDHKDGNVLDTFRRVAKAVASVEVTEELKKEWETKFFDLLNGFKITPGGRIYSNAGTDFGGTTLLNCFVGPKPDYDQDSLEGIFKVLLWQAQTLKSEGGWGMNFSFIRPRGAFINGIGVETPGAVKYMELFDKVSEIITSGSGRLSKNKKAKGKIRKGAMLASLGVFHPDCEEFITAKLHQGRLSKFNLSVECTNDFMDLIVSLEDAKSRGDEEFVKNNDKWDFVFPDTTHPKYKTEWDGNIQLWKSKGYEVIKYNTISALSLWDKIMKSTFEKNDPGVLFTGIANKTHCWNYGKNSHISTTNPCQPAWAELLTPDGIKTLGEVKIGDKIWSTEGWTTVVNKWSTGIKSVYRYRTFMGDEFIGTRNHRVVSEGNKIEARFATKMDCFEIDVSIEGPSKDTSPCAVSQVDYIRDEEVFDITVDNSTHTYWTGGVNVSNCGEQNLPFGGCCNLSSLNLTQFINESFTDFDHDKVAKYVSVAVRFLDNVNSLTSTPLPQYQSSVDNRRRIGLGVMGWASSLYAMRIPFASDRAEQIKESLMKTFTKVAVETSINLAVEKGMFTDCDPEKHANAYFWSQIGLSSELIQKIRKNGIRNSALFSIQPTGNTSILANVVSGGIEPVFLTEYIRTVIVPEVPVNLIGKTPKYWEGDYTANSFFKEVKEGQDNILRAEIDGIVYKIDKNRGLTKEVLCEDYGVRLSKKLNQWDSSADWARTTANIPVEDHVKDMKNWAKWIDSAISKTVNVPNNYSYNEFKSLYLNAYKTGYIKGLTTYRAGTMTTVLSSVSDKKEEKNPELDIKIHKTHAPKRGNSLTGEMYHPVLKGIKYYVVVGLMGEDVYEVFTGLNTNTEGDPIFPKSLTTGTIIKHGGGKYEFRSSLNNQEYHLTNGHNDPTADALTRMISTALRHGTPIEFVVQQLEKTKGEMGCFAKVVGRTLKKYIKDGKKVSGKKCESCGGDLVYSEGCVRCSQCGSSRCS